MIQKVVIFKQQQQPLHWCIHLSTPKHEMSLIYNAHLIVELNIL